MIGKAGLGNYAKGILEYCYYEKNKITEEQRSNLTKDDVRGDLVYVQNLALDFKKDGRMDIEYLTKQFVHNRNANQDLNKFIWHQTFSFPPEEKVKNETIREICQSFSKEFGFENNQMIAFIHKDKPHQHFHIVANRISASGKNTADHFNNYRRTGEFCRKIEKEFGLTITPEMMHKREKKEVMDKNIDFFKEKLSVEVPKALASSTDFNEFSQLLRKQDIQCDVGRGLTFSDTESRQKVKGSSIDRKFSLQNIKGELDENLKRKKKKKLEQKKQISL